MSEGNSGEERGRSQKSFRPTRFVTREKKKSETNIVFLQRIDRQRTRRERERQRGRRERRKIEKKNGRDRKTERCVRREERREMKECLFYQERGRGISVSVVARREALLRRISSELLRRAFAQRPPRRVHVSHPDRLVQVVLVGTRSLVVVQESFDFPRPYFRTDRELEIFLRDRTPVLCFCSKR